jgi:hypothetical protein
MGCAVLCCATPHLQEAALHKQPCLTSSTLCAVRAEVSKKIRPCSFANCSPSSVDTARRCCTQATPNSSSENKAQGSHSGLAGSKVATTNIELRLLSAASLHTSQTSLGETQTATVRAGRTHYSRCLRVGLSCSSCCCCCCYPDTAGIAEAGAQSETTHKAQPYGSQLTMCK